MRQFKLEFERLHNGRVVCTISEHGELKVAQIGATVKEAFKKATDSYELYIEALESELESERRTENPDNWKYER